MPRPKTDLPSPSEIRALIFLNEHGPATVNEYFFEGGFREAGRAYTTVMSLLDIMHDKGFVTRKAEGRAFRYTATVSLADLRARVLKNVLESVFGGSLDEMKSTVAKMEAPSKRKK